MKALRKIRSAARWLASIEVWLVMALAASGVLSERLLLPAVLVVALFWALRWLGRGRLSLPTPLNWPAAGMALLLPVTLLASPLPEITLPQVYRLLVGIALCYAIANHAWNPAGLRWMLAGVIGLSAALGLAALLSVNWPTSKIAQIHVSILMDLPRLVGEQVHPNVMAGTLAMLALFGPGWLLFGGRQTGLGGRILLVLAAAFICGVLVYTKSRGAWLGLATGLAVLVVLRWPRWGTAALLAACLAGGLFLASNPGLVQEFLGGADGYNTITTIQFREVIWARAVMQIEEFPLTGIGMGTFPQVTRALYQSFLLSAGNIPHAHNLFLQIAVDLGLPGLLAWLVMLIGVVRCAWQVYRTGLRQANWLAALGAGLLAAQAALAVHGLVDAVTWGTRPAVVVWGLWGLALAGWVLVRKDAIIFPQNGA